MQTLYKYPRTPHLPFSETITADDKKLENTNHFIGKEIIITEKMDGENTTIYKDYYHARSLDSKHRDYHSYLLSYIRNFQYLIPENYRICGEYLYATHSIYYDNLNHYFQVFGIYNENNICLKYEDTIEICNKLNLIFVPVLYKGIYNENLVKKIAKEVVDRGGEGIVIRINEPFHYNDFSKNVAKFVRKNHVQTSSHWSEGTITINSLKK